MATRSSSSTPKPRSLLSRLRLMSWRGRFEWLLSMLFVAVLVCWLLARMTPSWYLPLDPTNNSVMDTALRAQEILHFELRNTVERVPLGEQRWTITQDEVNSLLAVSTASALSGGAGGGGPADPAQNPVSDPFVVFSRGRVTVCARIARLPSGEAQGGVGSTTFSVGIISGPDGQPMGQVKLTRVWAGYLPVPRLLLQSWMARQVPAMTEAVRRMVEVQFGLRDVVKAAPIVQQILEGVGEGRSFPLQYKVDKKEFVIKELRVDDGSLTVVLAPLKPAATASQPAATQ